MNPPEQTDKLRRAYKNAFKTPSGKQVLLDLADLCGATSVPFVPGDPHATSYRCGRLEVWKRIQAFLNLTEQDIYDLAHQHKQQQGDYPYE